MMLLLVMLHLTPWFRWCLPGFPTIMLLFFFVPTLHREEDDGAQPTLYTEFKGWAIKLLLLGEEYQRVCENQLHLVGGPLRLYRHLSPPYISAHQFYHNHWVLRLLWGVLMGISNSLIPSVFIIWNSSVRTIWLFFLIYLIIYWSIISTWTHGFILYSLGYNPILPVFTLATGRSFGLTLMSFWHAWPFSFCLNISWLSGTTLGFRIILCFSDSVLGPAISLGSPGSSYWRMVHGNQGLDSECAHCSWGITASRCSQQRERRNTERH